MPCRASPRADVLATQHALDSGGARILTGDRPARDHEVVVRHGRTVEEPASRIEHRGVVVPRRPAIRAERQHEDVPAHVAGLDDSSGIGPRRGVRRGLEPAAHTPRQVRHRRERQDQREHHDRHLPRGELGPIEDRVHSGTERHRLERHEQRQPACAVTDEATGRDVRDDPGDEVRGEPTGERDREADGAGDAQHREQPSVVAPHRDPADDRSPHRPRSAMRTVSSNVRDVGTTSVFQMPPSVRAEPRRPKWPSDWRSNRPTAAGSLREIEECRSPATIHGALTSAASSTTPTIPRRHAAMTPSDHAHDARRRRQRGGREGQHGDGPARFALATERIDQPWERGARQQQRPLPEHQTLGDERVPHRERRCRQLGQERTLTQQARGADRQQEQRCEQHESLHDRRRDRSSEQRGDRVRRHGTRQPRAEAPDLRAVEIQVGHPHHVVRQDVPAAEKRQADRPTRGARTTPARPLVGSRAAAIASCSPLLLSDPGHGYCAVVRTTRATMTGGTLVAAGMMTMNIAVYGFNVIAARALLPKEFGALTALFGILLVGHRRVARAPGRHRTPPRDRSRQSRRHHRRDRPGHGHRRVRRRPAGRRVHGRPDPGAQARQLLGGDPVRRDPHTAHRHGRRVRHRPGHRSMGCAHRDLRRQRARPPDRRSRSRSPSPRASTRP